jgi:hypothetical protein
VTVDARQPDWDVMAVIGHELRHAIKDRPFETRAAILELNGGRSKAPYSARSALIGEIAAARPAGMMAAKNAHPASDPAATVRAKGSQNDTP